MRVLILGGGVTGLAAAHYLRRLAPSSCQITVLEAAVTPGGWVSSTRHSDGVVYEHGPRTVRPSGINGLNTVALLEQLGLQTSVRWVSKSHPAARNRLLYVDGRLHRLPNSLVSMFRSLPPFDRPLVLSAITDLRASATAQSLQDDSMYAFTTRRFGEHVARFLVDPLVRGVCAGDARNISVRLLFNQLFEYERCHGGVLRGYLHDRWRNRRQETPLSTAVRHMQEEGGGTLWNQAVAQRWAVWSLAGGLQTLTDRLAACLTEHDSSGEASRCQLFTNTRVVALNFGGDKRCVNGATAITDDGRRCTADHVISALPAHSFASILAANVGDCEASAAQQALANDLSSIESVTTAVVNLEYDSRDINEKTLKHEEAIHRNAFGYLIPSSQPSAGVLGVTFDSCAFPPSVHRCSHTDTSQPHRDSFVFTVMAGGVDYQRHLGGQPDEQFLVQLAREQLRCSLGIHRPPQRSLAKLLPQCIPQYHVGHQALVARLRQSVTQQNWPLILAGAAYDGISVNDCIMSAKRAAQSITNN